MADLKYYDVILKPIVTEKSMNFMSDKKYAFSVHPDATSENTANSAEEASDDKAITEKVAYDALSIEVL